jgi:hypothetical protein
MARLMIDLDGKWKILTILLSPGISESSLIGRSHMSTKRAIRLIERNDERSEHCDENPFVGHALCFSDDPRKTVKQAMDLFWGMSVLKLTSNGLVGGQEELRT